MSTSEDQQQSSSSLPNLFCAEGTESAAISDEELKSQIISFLDTLGPREDVLLLPPDYTRFHSQAGKISQFICQYYNFIGGVGDSISGDEEEASPAKKAKSEHDPSSATSTTTTSRNKDGPQIQILPALGTHAPMTDSQIKTMFGNELAAKEPNPFVVHNWRTDVETIGYAPAEMVSKATYGMVKEPWPAQLNKLVWDKRHHHDEHPTNSKQPSHKKSLVLSIGQVVPHEVMGMANFNKNVFVGTGGVEAINLSHFIGAVHGMEKMMGRASNPLRSILNYASEKFLESQLDLWYILTVMGTNQETAQVEMRGLYIGNNVECYNRACELSLKVNFTLLEDAPKKMVVYLDEDEFHSTWLGNKAIYRTRMAIADGGELIILAPGVKSFGEDEQIDKLIRKYGYVGTPKVMQAMGEHQELKDNLSAVAHLIHGSSEGRFSVTYCPGHLTREEVEGVGFKYADLDSTRKRYNEEKLSDGWHDEVLEDGSKGRFYFVRNPALGLWAVQSRFDKS